MKTSTLRPYRRISLTAGVLYLITFCSIPTLALYAGVRDPRYVLGSGPDAQVFLAGILELVVALACIGTAVILYPVVKRQHEGIALGFVSLRTLEAATIFAGVGTLFAVVSLRQSGAGADALITAQALIALNQWTFLLGQGLLPAANALLLGSLLFRSGLVPRILPIVGFVGAPLLVASAGATMFGLWGQVSALSGLAALPVALWELALGVWLVVKGFNPVPLLDRTRLAGESINPESRSRQEA